jgi:hypothetical protein
MTLRSFSAAKTVKVPGFAKILSRIDLLCFPRMFYFSGYYASTADLFIRSFSRSCGFIPEIKNSARPLFPVGRSQDGCNNQGLFSFA